MDKAEQAERDRGKADADNRAGIFNAGHRADNRHSYADLRGMDSTEKKRARVRTRADTVSAE